MNFSNHFCIGLQTKVVLLKSHLHVFLQTSENDLILLFLFRLTATHLRVNMITKNVQKE